MDYPYPTRDEDDDTTFIFRSNYLFSRRAKALFNGASRTTSDSVIRYRNNENIGGGNDVNEEVADKSTVKMSEKGVNVFPPPLTTLNENGRPEFTMQKIREEGRLRIIMIPNQFSEVVRSPEDGDGVKMEFSETRAD
ncbi:hypothetical protein POM88_047349 [Heracleum sosnowskyi]|uniref:FAF domain-containing protein n=1 Tax=Heracleum sosnowskyi TaxID=360622 RepID=A0AAD8LZE9_9APIA|nr:hypothetical protein POM88_047349 [Heracleum sosnowskyi]